MNKKAIIISVIATLALIIILKIANAVNSYFFIQTTVFTKGMEPTLQPLDVVLIQRVPPSINTGDIIAYSAADSSSPKAVSIQRVIAKGGDKISYKLVSQDVYEVFVNGVKLDEPYLEKGCKYFNGDKNVYASQTVPKNNFYVLGDNRKTSYDSRFTGPVSIANVTGKVTKIVKPKKRKRTL